MEKNIYFDIKKPTLELRQENETDTPTMTIAGIIPYESRSLDLGFFEIIKPTAFNKTLSDKADVKLLQNHESMKPLARTKNDTLKLRSDNEGLHFEAVLNPNISFHRDVFETIKNGIADGVSFGFQVIKDAFRNEGGKVVRELLEVKLKEISVGVVFPAYEASEAYTREVREIYENQNLTEEQVQQNKITEQVEVREDEKKDKEKEDFKLEEERIKEQMRIKHTLLFLENVEREYQLLALKNKQ